MPVAVIFVLHFAFFLQWIALATMFDFAYSLEIVCLLAVMLFHLFMGIKIVLKVVRRVKGTPQESRHELIYISDDAFNKLRFSSVAEDEAESRHWAIERTREETDYETVFDGSKTDEVVTRAEQREGLGESVRVVSGPGAGVLRGVGAGPRCSPYWPRSWYSSYGFTRATTPSPDSRLPAYSSCSPASLSSSSS